MPGSFATRRLPAAAEPMPMPITPPPQAVHTACCATQPPLAASSPGPPAPARRGHGALLGSIDQAGLGFAGHDCCGWVVVYPSVQPSHPGRHSQRKPAPAPIELAPGLNPTDKDPAGQTSHRHHGQPGHGLCRSKAERALPRHQAKPAPAPSAAPAGKRHSACPTSAPAPAAPAGPPRPPSLRRSPAVGPSKADPQLIEPIKPAAKPTRLRCRQKCRRQ